MCNTIITINFFNLLQLIVKKSFDFFSLKKKITGISVGLLFYSLCDLAQTLFNVLLIKGKIESERNLPILCLPE